MIPLIVDAEVELEEVIEAEVGEVVEVPTGRTQTKTVTPADEAQTVTPDSGFLLSSVTVHAIPSNYGKITYNGAVLTVS